METVEGLELRNGYVDLDNKCFKKCRFINCRLSYSGSETGWDEDTEFIGCLLEFSENARRTVNVLLALNCISKDPLLSSETTNWVLGVVSVEAPAITSKHLM